MQERRLSFAQRVKIPLRFLCGFGTCLVALAAEPTDHDGRLATVIDALRQQPLNESERQRIMGELAAFDRDATDNKDGCTALYLSGRLRQLHGETEEPAEFRTLIANHSAHPLAQLARVKLILRRLYALAGPPPAERLQAAEVLGGELTLPALQSDFHLAMGDAYVFFGDQREAALRHFAAAERLGIPGSATRGTVLVQIGELARLTGDRALAAQAYRTFLEDFPRDIRQQIVRDRLAAVTGGVVP